MVRPVVTILIGLQMLMPPGMCLCRFAAAATPRSDAAAFTSHAARPCCSSCGSPQHAGDGCPARKPSGPADTNTPPGPPRDHLPGCPAVAPDVSAKLPAPSDIAFDAASAAHAPAPAADFSGESLRAARPIPPLPSRSDPPLYVTFCVLRN